MLHYLVNIGLNCKVLSNGNSGAVLETNIICRQGHGVGDFLASFWKEYYV